MVRGGMERRFELCDGRRPVRRYVENPNEKLPYWQAYDYYAKRLQEFSSAVFLKCDDDIVYLDLEKLSEFIEFRRGQPELLRRLRECREQWCVCLFPTIRRSTS